VGEPDIAWRQVEQLLDTGAAVVQQGEQHVVTLTIDPGQVVEL
jgi:hypothetical protein